jgi:NADH-quinone oxidoreductase subunit K
MIVPLEHVIILSIIIFSIGIMGVLFRKNAIIIFMSIELMLNAVNLSLVGFSRYYNSVDGQVFIFLVMTLAAAEVAVGLAIIVSLFRNKQTINIDEMNILRG